jgi:hypothetical protein
METAMKKTIAAVAIALALVGSALAQDQPQPARGTNDAPVIAGIYYQSPTGYVRMELATSSGFKTSGMLKGMASYGVAKIHGKWLYRNPAAAAQLSDRRPVLMLISQVDISAQAVALVRFDVKKDRREAEFCEASAWTGVNTGDKNVIPLDVARVPNSNNMTIVLQSDLPAGEYLLIADQGKGYDGYDFGVK